tara:strand:- start:11972 stop:12181 length:210 start_codon:yes stop_codon:yes gene_type:complete
MRFNKFCCDTAKGQLGYICHEHGLDCPDIVLSYSKGEFYMVAANADYQAIFCFACGKNLKENCIVYEKV